MTSPSYHLTYAEQLRGRRFWLPVVGLVAATVVGVQLQASQYAAPVTSASSVLASDSLDVSLRTALTALGASGLPCQAPTTSSVTAVTCDFGVPATRVDFRSFGSHRLTVKALSAAEK
ncbi:MAG: hypothetical protein JO246_11120, partial [Frankiaceae bacterium]|nr:hypothetical protein [Frankiaceae bacterium]